MSDDRRAASPCWAPWWVEAYWNEHKNTLMEPSSNSPSLEHRNVQFSDSFRFFILKTPATFTNVSPFLIEKAITSAIGEVKSIRKHEGPKVCDVRRITIRRDGQVLNTKHLILTFSTPDLPQTVKMAYIRCPVRPYIPNPLRCFQCQRYGHSKNVCRGQPTCPRCGESGHDSADCKKKEQCLNCKGEHPAYSRSCPTWITEKEITAVKIKEKISYPEARRVVLARTPVSGKSYASATQSDSPRKPKSRRARQRDLRPHLTRIPKKLSRDFHRKIEDDTLTGDCSEDDEDLMDIQSGPSTSSSRGGAILWQTRTEWNEVVSDVFHFWYDDTTDCFLGNLALERGFELLRTFGLVRWGLGGGGHVEGTGEKLSFASQAAR
ncbi:uncharacterized protein TNCV_379731 [Trichonephila clavipes]|nr:uncharacterized protein TNCV_379731 [Trichonephila clavipes]